MVDQTPNFFIRELVAKKKLFVNNLKTAAL